MNKETKYNFSVGDLQMIQCALKSYNEELLKASNFPIAEQYSFSSEKPYAYALGRAEDLLERIEKELNHAANS